MSARKKTAVGSQLIVVDANVLRGASSTDGGPPVGAQCRRVLQAILEICHRAVVSPALAQEYDDHESNFGRRWRASMARRRKLVSTPATETGRARGWVQSAEFTERERDAVRKDLHLVLAAWEKDAVVLSADDRARVLFARVSDLAAMGWAQMGDGDVHAWLSQGAAPRQVRLGR